MTATLKNLATITMPTYDYLIVSIPQDRLSLTEDAYTACGWVKENIPAKDTRRGTTILSLKRARDLPNSVLLDEIQQVCETVLADIDGLKRLAVNTARSAAIAVGLIGLVVPYVVYQGVFERQTTKLVPLINERREVIAENTAHARSLMSLC